MAIAPLSVQLTDQIVSEERVREKKATKEVREAAKIVEEMTKTASLQASLGLGNPTAAVAAKKESISKLAQAGQADAMAEKFKAVHAPNEKFFPRFKNPGWGNDAEGSVKGRLPELVCAELGPTITHVRVRLDGTLKPGMQRDYQAPIPVIPPSILEKAAFAKQMAPDAKFHMLFMPSWEPAPQRDPVLLAYLPGVDEWFEIDHWGGDVDLIKEFLLD